jgi:hypothetical protein
VVVRSAGLWAGRTPRKRRLANRGPVSMSPRSAEGWGQRG